MWLDVSRAITASSPFQWLNEERIIQRLVELIHPREDEDVSTRARLRAPLARSPSLGPWAAPTAASKGHGSLSSQEDRGAPRPPVEH